MKLTRHDTPIITGPDEPVIKKAVRQPAPDSILALSRKYGINRSTLRNRLRAGKDIEDAVKEPIKTRLECGQMAAKARWGGSK